MELIFWTFAYIIAGASSLMLLRWFGLAVARAFRPRRKHFDWDAARKREINRRAFKSRMGAR